MARLLGPDEGSRAVYTVVAGTWRSGAGLTATIYADEAATQPADILTHPGGTPIVGGTVTVDSQSRIPVIQYPDGEKVVYGRVNGGPVVALHAQISTQTDDLDSRLATAELDEVQKQKLDKSTAHRGVNLAGAEFGVPGQAYDTVWRWPLQQEYDYVASRGHTLVRLPYMWERIQPTLSAAFDTIQQAHLIEAARRAKQAGLKLVLDLHNYAAYNGNYFGENDAPTLNDFIDVWVRTSNLFKDDPTVIGYGLMNEPRNMPTVGPETGRDRWVTWSQAVVDAIRANGDLTCVMVSGYSGGAMGSWLNTTTGTPTAWIVDPADNFMYEAHTYWDSNGGAYTTTYAQEDTNQSGTWGTDGARKAALFQIRNWLNWLRANQVRGFIGEVGWPRIAGATTGTDSTKWNAVADEFLSIADSVGAGIWVAVWAAGSKWSTGYALRYYTNDGNGDLAAPAENAATAEAHRATRGGGLQPKPVAGMEMGVRWRGWNGDIANTGSTVNLPNGSGFVSLIEIVEPGPLESLTLGINTAATSPTAGQCFAALFDYYTGTLITASADIGATLLLTGFQHLTFATKTRVYRPGERLYGYVLFNGTTPPNVIRFATPAIALGSLTRRWGVAPAATSVPATITPSGFTTASGAVWMAVSGN